TLPTRGHIAIFCFSIFVEQQTRYLMFCKAIGVFYCRLYCIVILFVERLLYPSFCGRKMPSILYAPHFSILIINRQFIREERVLVYLIYIVIGSINSGFQSF